MQPQLKSVPVHDPAQPEPSLDIAGSGAPSAPLRRHLVRWSMPVLLLVAGLGLWLWWQARPIAVTIVHPRLGNATALVYATGYVEADHPVSVSARETAPVVRVLVDEGDVVTRGQPLALLEDDQQRALAAQARATADQAAVDAQRALALFAQGWSTRASRDAAVSTATAARAAERSARAALDQLVVRAGISGVVIKRDVEPGSLAVPGAILLQLGDPRHRRITATVDERDVPRLRVGQPAVMTNEAWPGRVIHGHVREITPNGDPTQRAFRVRLAADEARDLPFGLTLEVNIVTRQDAAALLVPAGALDGDKLWVVRDGRAYRETIVPGIVGASEAQIVRGVGRETAVIVDPPPALRDGQAVRSRS